jgi:hypothetical protein
LQPCHTQLLMNGDPTCTAARSLDMCKNSKVILLLQLSMVLATWFHKTNAQKPTIWYTAG